MNINRRNFIGSLLAAGAGFMILPPAAEGRIWKASKTLIVPKKYSDWFWYTEDGVRHCVWDDRRLDLARSRMIPDVSPLAERPKGKEIHVGQEWGARVV